MPDNNDAATTPTPTLPTVAADAPVPSDPVSGVADAPIPNVPVATDPAGSAENAPVEGTPADSAPAEDGAGKDKAIASEIPAEVAHKISESHNVLVALSSDPSVDEMAAAIGLTLFLDKLGKRATAIYSGSTPNALEFLKPEETFEPSVDTLQDFVIALNKDKADHLRYKLDGDFVKIYITPYKSKIGEEDLDFSYGDYNVDLVLALDVANGVDLDAALREHGRIMHDAVIINITTGNPGKLGEIEWSDKSASSVSEMIARLIYSANSKAKIEKEEATAFLTGIVAATDRFSNASTTPEAMSIASKLMESGADQQLVSKNITPDIENEMANMGSLGEFSGLGNESDDPTKLDIKHEDKKEADASEAVDEQKEEKKDVEVDIDEAKDDAKAAKPSETTTDNEDDTALLDDLKAAEASLVSAGAETVPETQDEPLKVDSTEAEAPQELAKEVTDTVDAGTGADEIASAPVTDAGEIEAAPASADSDVAAPVEAPASTESGDDSITEKPEKVIQPPSDIGDLSAFADSEANKYGQMLEEALESAGGSEAPMVATSTVAENPAAAGAPAVPANPEINGVPEINYMPMPGDTVLPPPPTPPIDMDTPMAPTEPAVLPEPVIPAEPIAPAAPAMQAEPAVSAAPAPETPAAEPVAQPQNPAPQVNDPSAFKIPGM